MMMRERLGKVESIVIDGKESEVTEARSRK
jgi:hypothetical protein